MLFDIKNLVHVFMAYCKSQFQWLFTLSVTRLQSYCTWGCKNQQDSVKERCHANHRRFLNSQALTWRNYQQIKPSMRPLDIIYRYLQRLSWIAQNYLKRTSLLWACLRTQNEEVISGDRHSSATTTRKQLCLTQDLSTLHQLLKTGVLYPC